MVFISMKLKIFNDTHRDGSVGKEVDAFARLLLFVHPGLIPIDSL